MRLIFTSQATSTFYEGSKMEYISLFIRSSAAHDTDERLEIQYSRKKGSDESWGNPHIVTNCKATQLKTVYRIMASFNRMLVSEDSNIRIFDPSSVMQEITRNGQGHAVYDERVEKFISVSDVSGKGGTRYFPTLDGEPLRDYGVMGSNETQAAKRIANNFLKAMDSDEVEDPTEIIDLYASWLKGGRKVEELAAVEPPKAPSLAIYYTSKTEEEVSSELEAAGKPAKAKRKRTIKKAGEAVPAK